MSVFQLHQRAFQVTRDNDEAAARTTRCSANCKEDIQCVEQASLEVSGSNQMPARSLPVHVEL